MKNIKLSVKHHYIPHFYLSNFIGPNDNNTRLWITDLKQWKAAHSAIAYQNKLYSLEDTKEGQATETDINEKAFSQLECMAAPVIKEILITEKLPT